MRSVCLLSFVRRLLLLMASAALVILGAAGSLAHGQDFSVLVNFGSTNGAYPQSGLIQASDGNLYGTTELGGAHGGGEVYQLTSTAFNPSFYAFCQHVNGFICLDGEWPLAAPVQGTDGNLYGTTSLGGSSTTCQLGCGTLYQLSLQGTLTTLHNFCSGGLGCPDGSTPAAPLVQGSEGFLRHHDSRRSTRRERCFKIW